MSELIACLLLSAVCIGFCFWGGFEISEAIKAFRSGKYFQGATFSMFALMAAAHLIRVIFLVLE